MKRDEKTEAAIADASSSFVTRKEISFDADDYERNAFIIWKKKDFSICPTSFKTLNEIFRVNVLMRQPQTAPPPVLMSFDKTV